MVAAALAIPNDYCPHDPLPRPTIYTDHLNSTRIINDSLVLEPLPHSWQAMPAHSLCRWLRDRVSRRPQHPALYYTPAYTGPPSVPARLNAVVGHLATPPQYSAVPPPPVYLPTLCLGDFVLFSPSHEFVELTFLNFTLVVPAYLTRPEIHGPLASSSSFVFVSFCFLLVFCLLMVYLMCICVLFVALTRYLLCRC
ncbi:hypothetical protein BV22DRAFT_848488 [Leucogyrophana mollusca]|uniref:Uncharacterized protein n=1 Tax=Leucogyrophana mollusca TaxID=85980 RepID=A0ACB8B392_9AGAM|nr:hypothetical protein BV22DRAFT_848488 [Leucogyrophana mollusca]